MLAIAAALPGALLLPAAASPAPAAASPAAQPDAGHAVRIVALATASTRASVSGDTLPDGDWVWPVQGIRTVVEPFRAPAHDYGPGHRGMDIAASGELRAPAAGVVAFRGVVVDRPLLTIDHGNGLVTTIEPARSDLAPGTAVGRGEAVAMTAAGGHTPAGAVHIGVRWNGVYINPMLLFGEVPRAVLLPCGAGGC